MSVPPQPPPPPPPPPGAPSTPAPTGLAGMHSLRDQASPYSILLAMVVLVIMSAPNVVFYLLDRAVSGRMPVQAEPAGGSLVFGLIVALVLQLIIFVAAMVPLLIRRRLDGRLFGPSQPTGSWLALGFGLVAGIIALFAAYGVNIVLALVAGTDEPVEQQLLQDALGGGLTLVLAGVIAVIVAPIVEEIVFRGVLFRALADRIGLWVGAVVSSAVFALIHIEVVTSQPIALGGLFAVGLALALAFHYTGNLLVPIVGHAVFNGASLSLALVVDRLGLDEMVAWLGSVSLAVRAAGIG